MSIKEQTREFQKQVSQRLTELFGNNLNDGIRGILDMLKIIINLNGGVNGANIELNRILECISEPETFYFENDAFNDKFDQPRGNKIYSPRIDLCISPSFIKDGTIKSRCFMNILLPIGSRENIYNLMEEIGIIRQLKNDIKQKSNENYRSVNIYPTYTTNNLSPLYLFGIEIENNPNKKHLMGDFMNSYMLSKYPVVLVQQKSLEMTLNFMKFIYTIKNLKGIDFTCLSNVNLLTIKQFTEIVNKLLMQNNLPVVHVDGYE